MSITALSFTVLKLTVYCRSFVLTDLCDKVDAQNLGPSISSISGYLEGRLMILKHARVRGTTQVMLEMVLLCES